MTKYPESFDYLKSWISLCGGGAAVFKAICMAKTLRNWIWVATEAAPSNFVKPRCHRRRGVRNLPLTILKILVPNLATRLIYCVVHWLITAILVIFFTQASPRPLLWHPHVKVRVAAIDDHHYLVEEFSAEDVRIWSWRRKVWKPCIWGMSRKSTMTTVLQFRSCMGALAFIYRCVEHCRKCCGVRRICYGSMFSFKYSSI